jgi:hypothetical protein
MAALMVSGRGSHVPFSFDLMALLGPRSNMGAWEQAGAGAGVRQGGADALDLRTREARPTEYYCNSFAISRHSIDRRVLRAKDVPTFLLLPGLALGAGGAALLRAATRGDRRLVVAGWAAMAAMTTAFGLVMGAETGVPAAIAVFAILALALVLASASRKPWRAKERPAADGISPARRESWTRAASRWIAAGPLAFVSAILFVSALAHAFGGQSEDTLILAMTAIVITWSALAAWAFSTRRPLRTFGLIAALGLVGAAAIAASILQ